jgi:hypothetical protein
LEGIVQFWASSEIYQPADAASETVRRTVEPVLNSLLNSSTLAGIDLLLRYVPVIMPEHFLDRYPARSKVIIKQRILDCAPHLDYSTFVSGSFLDQLEVYLAGLRTASPLLARFGLSNAEVSEFEATLTKTREAVTLSGE